MPEPQCADCGDFGRHADGASVVFCSCAAGARAQAEHVALMTQATMDDEIRAPRAVTP